MPAQLKDLAMPTQTRHLALLKKGDGATITGLAVDTNPEQLTVKMRLLELGFAPGVKVRVVAESFPRRDPMAVRLGNTTFALRRHEAAMIHIAHTDAVMTRD